MIPAAYPVLVECAGLCTVQGAGSAAVARIHLGSIREPGTAVCLQRFRTVEVVNAVDSTAMKVVAVSSQRISM